MHVFRQSDFDPSKRGPLKRDDDFTLKDYELKAVDANDDLFKVGEIEHKETKAKFKVLLCLTEISNFTRNEIIEFTQKVNIMAQLNHPSIQKFVNFSPVDLKPSNIYHDEYCFPKISRFHLSVEIKDKDNDEYESAFIQGTPAYLSPEIYNDKKYSKSSDVYSFSLFLYEIMTNQKPFKINESIRELKNKICELKTRPEFKVPIPPAYRNLIERCWSEDPKDRPTFETIVEELKTNQLIIQYFYEYVKYVDEAPNSLKVDKKIKQLKGFIQNKLWCFSEYETKIIFRGIYETEEKDVLFNFDFVNIENFTKQKLINNCDYYKIYSVLNKEKGELYALTNLFPLD